MAQEESAPMHRNRTRRGSIETRHQKHCRHRTGGRCNCEPSHRATVTDPHSGDKLRSKWLQDHQAAEQWLGDALNALTLGLRPSGTGPRTTVGEWIDELLERMADGRMLDRSGERYRPATVRSYEQAARKYAKPELGHFEMRELRRRDVQDFVDFLRSEKPAGAGLAASTVHNKLDVVRVAVRYATDRDEGPPLDPFTKLRLPSIRRKPKQVADPERAERLLDALPDALRALWAVLFYAGLRISEARALRWTDVDLDPAVSELRVARGWDDKEGELEDPKTDAGKRVIPVTGRLRAELVRHKLATGRGGADLVFGRTAGDAFVRSTIRSRTLKVWKDAGLASLTPHEARHTCASYLIAAGVNDMQLQRYIGHTDVRTTKNIYGHLFPDDTQRVGAALDAFLDGRSRGSAVGPNGTHRGG